MNLVETSYSVILYVKKSIYRDILWFKLPPFFCVFFLGYEKKQKPMGQRNEISILCCCNRPQEYVLQGSPL